MIERDSMNTNSGRAWREFHISRRARDRYRIDEALFTTDGRIVMANFRAARLLAQRMNARRDLGRFPEKAVRAGQLNALGLIDEVFHLVVEQYRLQRNPQMAADALAWLDERLGRAVVDAALRTFADEFPPKAVYTRRQTVEEYLADTTEDIPNRALLLEELLMLWLENVNPACAPYMELLDDARLERETAYPAVIKELCAFFADQPVFGPENQSLVEMLRTPARVAPHSLAGQLEYILQHWGYLLGALLYRLLRSLDLIAEEEKAIFFGPGPSEVPEYDASLADEPERFSPDKDWMPHVVLMAKNAYVWLDQLSRRYGRAIMRLDEIPDEELDLLAHRGFTGLWLIGVWERSPASARIKQMMGNPEAVASAYSLSRYDVAWELGGPEALDTLRARAWQRGIRLASDMVPNHMGIDSDWVVEHPDWFIGLDYSPFPSYSFSGPNLSHDDRAGIYVEDHYYNRTDAAVVFKRVDHGNGSERYIYHGNDGTSMPWNDTAQLDYRNPAVREAVIQTILHVARQFPIIRFDAAMTLAKRHYQRLWFPEPGSGGAIPSRAEHGLTRRQFHEAMPQEFWREVVDRIAAEAPDTLLLAEAFWLMEGYFVRTLGMHRVYNSAFMNMLRDEENTKYRWVMKNTLEFDPEILKRFVNFMNNPDERTAIDQFGKEDKYFGICTMMVTLPGLPMFGHGQVEGFSEKYGMEYRRAYWDEWEDSYLADRHARQIFPLLHRRHVFAEVKDFLLYDFWCADGHVNDDVFAYSNRRGDERALVVYHNRYSDTRGWVRMSVGYMAKDGSGKHIAQRSLADGLGLHGDDDHFTLYRDAASGLEYIRGSRELTERGLYLELGAYQTHVFVDVREVADDVWHHYRHLHDYLRGRGVPSLDAAMVELLLQPVQRPFCELVNAGQFRWLLEHVVTEPDILPEPEPLDEVEGKLRTLLYAARDFTGGMGDMAPLAAEIRARIEMALCLPVLLSEEEADLLLPVEGKAAAWALLFGWLCVHDLGKAGPGVNSAEEGRGWLDEWHFGRLLAGVLREFGLDEHAADYAVTMVKALTTHQRWYQQSGGRRQEIIATLLADPDVQRVVQMNRYQGALWFNKEAFEQLLQWLDLTSTLLARADGEPEEALADRHALITELRAAAEEAAYQAEELLDQAGEAVPV